MVKVSRQKREDLQAEEVEVEKPIIKKKLIGSALHVNEIEKYLSELKHFQLIIIPHDNKTKDILLFPDSSFIFLLEANGEKERQANHYVALIFDPAFKEIDFYDSFGRTPKELGIKPLIYKLMADYIERFNPKHLYKVKINRILRK